MQTNPRVVLTTVLGALMVALALLGIASPAHGGEGTVTYTLSTGTSTFRIEPYLPASGTPVLDADYSASVQRFPACSNVVLASVRVTVSMAAAANFSAVGLTCAGISGVYANLMPIATATGVGFQVVAAPPALQTPNGLAFTPPPGNNCSVAVTLIPNPTSGTAQGQVAPSALSAWRGTGSVNVSLQVRFVPEVITSPSTPLIAQFDPILSATTIEVRFAYTTPAFDPTGDAVVDGADLAVVLGAWGSTSGGAADVDGSGAVDANDLAIVLGNWGPIACN
jgi:hypothetical protein